MFNSAESVILELLARERRWWYGLELVEASGERLRPGMLYVHLGLMVERGLVEVREETDNERMIYVPENILRRRLYRIGDVGMREWGSFANALPEPA